LAKCNELSKQSYCYASDKPDFSFEKLQSEIVVLIRKIKDIKLKIQKTNMQIKVKYSDGKEHTLSDLIIDIADIRTRIAVLNDLYAPKDEWRSFRYEEKEAKYQVPPEEIMNEITDLNKEKSNLDSILQHTNWTVELIE